MNIVQSGIDLRAVIRKMHRMTPTGQRTPRRDVLRHAILDAARAIVLREGFDALSMRKIADVIGYSPASLYLHFDNRDAIAHALCAEGHAQLMDALRAAALSAQDQPAQTLRGIARAYVAFAHKHPQTYRLIFMENPVYTEAAIGHGASTLTLLGQHVQTTEAAEALWAALHGIASLSLTAGAFLSLPTDTLVEYALAPVAVVPAIGKTVRRRAADRRA